MKFQYTQGRLKQVATMKNPEVMTVLDQQDLDPLIKKYKEHLASLLSYTADPSDWKEGEIVEEGEFELQHQAWFGKQWEDTDQEGYEVRSPEARRIIARRVKKPDTIQNDMIDAFGGQAIEMNDLILKTMEAGGIDRGNKAMHKLFCQLAIQIHKKENLMNTETK